MANGEILKINDQKEASFLFNRSIFINERDNFSMNRFGKVVMAKIIYNKKIESEPIGILNSIKDLKKLIQSSLVDKKIKKLIIETKIIEEGDIRSFFSLGITKDFKCIVEHEE